MITCLEVLPSDWIFCSNSELVKFYYHQFSEAGTKARRNEIFDEHGIRFSSLHKLLYREHVRHTALGLLHSRIEGILQHHAHVRYGIGILDTGSKTDDIGNHATPPATPNASHKIDIDIDMLDDELANPATESQEYACTPSHGRRLHSEPSFQLINEESDSDLD